ncbi:hypothetical protein K7432_003561 [Basidiobolus ranarum]|uniref:DASH complex subunit ASK1 n=1 Tax=Basidiobolus ranarum TaxID=34480 RepID=A0ABR2WZP7_9FUNG
MSITQEPLAATNDMEKIEQNITLILQEIDKNFSSCHATATNNLLPRVNHFCNTSKQIIDDVKPWLQFFELVNEFESISERVNNTIESPNIKGSQEPSFISPTSEKRSIITDTENSPAYPILQSQHIPTPVKKIKLPKLSTPLLHQVFAKSLQEKTNLRSVHLAPDAKFKDKQMERYNISKVPDSGATPRSIKQILSASRASSERKPSVRSASLPSRMRDYTFGNESPIDSPLTVDTPFSAARSERLVSGELSLRSTPQANNSSTSVCHSIDAQSYKSYNSNSTMEEPELKTSFAKLYSDTSPSSSDIDTPTLLTPNLDKISVVDSDHSLINTLENQLYDNGSPTLPQPRMLRDSLNQISRQTFHNEEEYPVFSLSLFPKAFQESPGSDQLASLYNQFRQEPIKALNMQDLRQALPEFDHERLSLLINLLVRRKLVKRSNQYDGWSMCMAVSSQ